MQQRHIGDHQMMQIWNLLLLMYSKVFIGNQAMKYSHIGISLKLSVCYVCVYVICL